MTDIPEDILCAAERTLDAVLCVCSSDDGGADYVRSESINNIAGAILAERQACEASLLADLDAAFDAEITRVSHLPYDSNEICRHFFGEVRNSLIAARSKFSSGSSSLAEVRS